MRVITGTARGRKLTAPPGLDTRPTTEMVKEAVFSAIQFEIEGASVLDLFAGSGQMGIEALSRGAKHCVFVDHSRTCQGILKQNLESTGLASRARVQAADALACLRSSTGPFDLAFLDPPYGSGMAEKALVLLAPLMREGGIVFCETAREDSLPEEAGDGAPLKKYREYRYGKIKVTRYHKDEADGNADS